MPIDAKINIEQGDEDLAINTLESNNAQILLKLKSALDQLKDEVKAIDDDNTTYPDQFAKDQAVKVLIDNFFDTQANFQVSRNYKSEMTSRLTYSVYIETPNGEDLKFFENPEYDVNGNPSGLYKEKYDSFFEGLTLAYPIIGKYIDSYKVIDTIKGELSNLIDSLANAIDEDYTSLMAEVDAALGGTTIQPRTLSQKVQNMVARLQRFALTQNGAALQATNNKILALMNISDQLIQAEAEEQIAEIEEFKKDINLRIQEDIDVFDDNFQFADKLVRVEQYIGFVDYYINYPGARLMPVTPTAGTPPLPNPGGPSTTGRWGGLSAAQSRKFNTYRGLFKNVQEYLIQYQNIVNAHNEIATLKELDIPRRVPGTGMLGSPNPEFLERKKKIEALEIDINTARKRMNNLRSHLGLEVNSRVLNEREQELEERRQERESRQNEREQEREERQEDRRERRAEAREAARVQEEPDSMFFNEDGLTPEGKDEIRKIMAEEYESSDNLRARFAPILGRQTMDNLQQTRGSNYRSMPMDQCMPLIQNLDFEQCQFVIKYIEVMANESKSELDRTNKRVAQEYKLLNETDGTMGDLRQLGRRLQHLGKKYGRRRKYMQKHLIPNALRYYMERERYNYGRVMVDQLLGKSTLETTQAAFGGGKCCTSYPGNPDIFLMDPNSEMMQFFTKDLGLATDEVLRAMSTYVSADFKNLDKVSAASIIEGGDIIDADYIIEMEEIEGGFDTNEYTYPNAILIKQLLSKRKKKRELNLTSYPGGSESLFQELALREITGRKNFSLAEALKGQGVSPEEQKEILQEAMLSLLDAPMAAYIRTKFEAYKNLYGPDDTRTYQIISSLFVEGIVDRYSGSYAGISDSIPVRDEIKASLQGVFGGGWNDVQGINNTTPNGNVIVGSNLNIYATNIKPDGLGLGADWLTKPLSPSERFLDENGNFKGLVPALEGMIRSVGAELGRNPATTKTVTTALKVGGAAYGLALGRQLVSYLTSGESLGSRLQKVGVTALAVYGVAPLIFEDNLITIGDRFLFGDTEGKGFFNKRVGELLDSEDPLGEHPELNKYHDMAYNVFGNLKMGQIADYIRPSGNSTTGFSGRSMTKNDYDDFIKRYGITDEQRRTGNIPTGKEPEAAVWLASIYNYYDGNMYEVSRALGLGLELSGLAKNEFTQYTNGAYANLSFINFQKSHLLLQQKKEQLLKVLGDEAGFEELFRLYLQGDLDMDLLEEKLEAMETFQSKLLERLPIIRSHFLADHMDPDYANRRDEISGYDVNLNLGAPVSLLQHPDINLDVGEADQIVSILDNQAQLDNLIMDFLSGKLSGSTGGNATSRWDAFESAYLDKFPSSGGPQNDDPRDFVSNYLIADNSINTGLEGLLNISLNTGALNTNIDNMVANGQDNWVVGQINYQNSGQSWLNPVPGLRETLISNVAGNPGVLSMMGVDSATQQLYFWMKDDDTGIWHKKVLKRIGREGASINGVQSIVDPQTGNRRLMLDIDIDDKPDLLTMDYQFFIDMFTTLAKGEKKFSINLNALDAYNLHAGSVQSGAPIITSNTGQPSWSDNFREKLFGTANNFLGDGTTIEFEDTGQMRPVRN